MTRSTSSATLAIFANDSTSASVSFGLLSTAAATSLFGSRMSWARCSRVPFEASFIFFLIGSAGEKLRLRLAAFLGLGQLLVLVVVLVAGERR